MLVLYKGRCKLLLYVRIFIILGCFRPAIDTLAAAMRRLGTTDFGDEEIGADDIRYIHHYNYKFSDIIQFSKLNLFVTSNIQIAA